MEQVGVKDNYRLVQNLKSAGCFIVCILLTLVCLVPLYLMIVNACRGHNAILQSPVSLIPGSNFVENMKNITTQSPQWDLLLDYRSWFYDFDRILLRNDCIRFDRLSVQGS